MLALFYVCEHSACMYSCAPYDMTKRRRQIPITRVVYSDELPYMRWAPNLDPLQEQQVLLIVKPSFQPQFRISYVGFAQ